MIEFKVKGNFKKTNSFLEKALNLIKFGYLDKYGKQGVEALMTATPKDSGKTAESWYYEINRTKERITLKWCNSNSKDGIPIAILIQYGHAFQNGTYVEGIDFINPAIKPIFQEIHNNIRKELFDNA